ncbi:unnamed protein product [Timema podura]|uniref:Uncharacterized protein n=1 Tax=Timema podura TaxID=61482 RepID=A0ABN7PP25_TIMPD|nr:unnamed protein product [Timema podura]
MTSLLLLLFVNKPATISEQCFIINNSLRHEQQLYD